MALAIYRVRVAIGLLVATGSMLGCMGSSGGLPPATAGLTADDESDGLFEHDRYHHHGGVTLLVAMSLDTLGVSADQHLAVEKIRGDLHTSMSRSLAAEQSLVGLLAEGVASGSMDAAKVDAAVVSVSVAANGVTEGSVNALDELHAVLTPAQRTALVDKVESHWAVWQAANAEFSGPVYPSDGHLAALAEAIGLTVEQMERIRAALQQQQRDAPKFDPQQAAAYVRAFGEGFRAAQFDARALVGASQASAHMVGWGAAHMARFVKTVSPTLTAEQRLRFAQRLREHAGHNPSA
jgi:Spy/CpxP family protein refolding chaperone